MRARRIAVPSGTSVSGVRFRAPVFSKVPLRSTVGFVWEAPLSQHPVPGGEHAAARPTHSGYRAR